MMSENKFLIFSTLLFTLWSTPGFSGEITYHVDVDEPTTQAPDENGVITLDDLAFLRFSLKRVDGSDWVTPIENPATSPNGGGHHSIDLTVSGVSGEFGSGIVEVRAVDLTGNESPPITQTIVVDLRTPNPPTNLEVTTTIK